MPEGLTYRDMWRRIAKGVPNTQNFKLKLFPLHGRTTAKDPALRKLTGLAKKKAKDNTSLDAFPSNMKSYPGFDALPDNIQTGIINLDGSDIQYHGKSLGIPLGQGFWIRIHCVLRGHVLLIGTEELNGYQASWRANPRAAPHIQMALINQDSTLPSIILCDRNKLATATFLHCSETSDFPPLPLWYDPQLGPCPFKEPAAWRETAKAWKPRKNTTTIFAALNINQHIFNGIGSSHASEILHLARISPAATSFSVYQDSECVNRLLNAAQQFFSHGMSTQYEQFVPAGRSNRSAFLEPAYISDYINKDLKVYRRTGATTSVSKDHYEFLYCRGLLNHSMPPLNVKKDRQANRDPFLQSKKVPIYCLKMDCTRPKHACTVIPTLPPGSKSELVPNAEAPRAIGSGPAEIGIASFMDFTVPNRQ
ncbi:MAG: hypothetical protein FRX48_03687 [Lasallia pustulata]|uniref:Uncharacterized protein n=1 Tax=Lasallia pustulata TaxID=136370 RepID=A0A5M8PUN0_9LECA|nr:MAG: hypothetical protein FRX48_03687 [Lasallia pustulata]